MSLNNILSDVINFLSSNEKFQSFFLSDIKSLNQYKSVWDENKIRIGLIGITSSGKSTLINALLCEKLLPQKVKPSSSVLVVCKYSTVKKAVIYFDENSDKDKKTIRKDISNELEKYGDEEFNPNNIEQVKEIHLYTPNFRLSKNISLVDSPGLDAYGMEAHEKITLQLALPTLDMILYLTTVKASSDKENLNRIDEITLDSKPLIVVQNMIDSIGAKKARDGIVKSVKEIQLENYNRMKRLLKKAAKKSTQEAKILQLSAYDALYNKHKDSNIEDLIDTIDKNKSFLQERQQNIQANQLIKKLSDILNNIIDIDSNGDVYQDKLNNLNKEYNIIEEYQKKYIINSEIITKSFSIKIKHIIIQIKKLSEMNISKAKAQLEEYKKSKINNEEKLSKRIKEAQKNLSSLAKQNNLTDKDLNFKPSSSLLTKIIQPSTTSKTVGQKGWKPTKTVVGKIKRGFGSVFGQEEWGKEWVDNTQTINYFDKEKLIKDIEDDKKLWSEWFNKKNSDFNKYMTEGLKKVENELSLQIRSIKEKQSGSISSNELKNIQTKINNYLQELKKLSTVKNDNINTEATEEILDANDQEIISEVPSIALNLFKLAHHNSYYDIDAIKDFCIENIQKSKIIIWGWGNEDIEDFVNLYYGKSISFPENKFCYNNNLIDLYNENNYVEHRDKKQIETLGNSSVGVFINANISQSGLFEKQFMNSRLNSFSNCKAVWVIHGMDILLNANTFIEALINLEYFLSSIKRESDLIIVSHKDSFYSLLIYELRKLNFRGVRLESDNREIIENIGKNREDELGGYVKEYLDKKGIQYA